jgi:hypothetical protein
MGHPFPRSGIGNLGHPPGRSMATNLARFPCSCKHVLPAVLFFLHVEQSEQHFLDSGRAGGSELLLDSGLQGCVADFDGHGSLVRLKCRGKEFGESAKSPEGWDRGILPFGPLRAGCFAKDAKHGAPFFRGIGREILTTRPLRH